MNAKDTVEGLAAWHADMGKLWIAQPSFSLACRAHAEPPPSWPAARPEGKPELVLSRRLGSYPNSELNASASSRVVPGPRAACAVPDGRAGGPAARATVRRLAIVSSMQPAKLSIRHGQCSVATDPPG